MIEEVGRIVAVEEKALWVETIQHSTCGTCVAQKGCGQTLLAKLGIGKSHIRVLLAGRPAEKFHIDDMITLGIPDDVVVKNSLIAYLMPLFLMMGLGFAADSFYQSELVTIVSAVSGLVLGGFFLLLHSRWYQNDLRQQPVIIENKSIDSITMSH